MTAGADPGTRYGPLTVVRVLKPGRKARVLFQCECGKPHESLLHTVKTRAKLGTITGCKDCQRKSIGTKASVALFKPERYLHKRYGRLLVTGVESNIDGGGAFRNRVVCLCDCGAQIVSKATDLTRGAVASCGCLHKELSREIGRELLLTHANSCDGELNGATPLYRAWCKVRGCVAAGKAKGAGRVCHEHDPRWEKFEEFFKDFGPITRYETISRIDWQQPWSKNNCEVRPAMKRVILELLEK